MYVFIGLEVAVRLMMAGEFIMVVLRSLKVINLVMARI